MISRLKQLLRPPFRSCFGNFVFIFGTIISGREHLLNAFLTDIYSTPGFLGRQSPPKKRKICCFLIRKLLITLSCFCTDGFVHARSSGFITHVERRIAENRCGILELPGNRSIREFFLQITIRRSTGSFYKDLINSRKQSWPDNLNTYRNIIEPKNFLLWVIYFISSR